MTLIPVFALAERLPTAPDRREVGDRLILAFDAIGYKRRDETPPPPRPVPRQVSAAARAWSWIMMAVLIAALLLPFSLAALVDLARYLGR